MTFISRIMLSYMKSANAFWFATIPPTLAAARNTYSGFSSSKNFSTASWRHRSNSLCVRVTIFVYPCLCSSLTIADPTMPRWPATYIFEFFSISNYQLSIINCQLHFLLVSTFLHRMLIGCSSDAHRVLNMTTPVRNRNDKPILLVNSFLQKLRQVHFAYLRGSIIGSHFLHIVFHHELHELLEARTLRVPT